MRTALIFLSLVVANCSDGSTARNAGDSETSPVCRNYMTSGSVDSDDFSGPTTGAFDLESREYTWTLGAAPNSMVVVRTYASVADFVNEAQAFGRILHQREDVTDSGGGWEKSFTYDEQKRRTQESYVGTPADFTITFDSWDTENRATSGILVTDGSCNTPVTVEFDPELRKRIETWDFPNGVGTCDIENQIIYWEVYDNDGNLAQRGSVWLTDPPSSMTFSVIETEEVCIE